MTEAEKQPIDTTVLAFIVSYCLGIVAGFAYIAVNS